MNTMLRRLVPSLAAGVLLLIGTFAHADTEEQITRFRQFTAKETLVCYEQMATLLHKVHDKKGADAAASPLKRQQRLLQAISLMADNIPESNSPLSEQHLHKLEKAMNEVRMSAARVLRENCYGSERLGKAIRSMVSAFRF